MSESTGAAETVWQEGRVQTMTVLYDMQAWYESFVKCRVVVLLQLKALLEAGTQTTS